LTHAFTLHGAHARRMVMPVQFWMLQRIEAQCDLTTTLGSNDLRDLPQLLEGCRVTKVAGRLYEDASANGRL
jgi:hypothetical protein